MPMTVTTGLSKKVGTANYGSVGTMCNITFEADHNLLEHDLEGFQQRVKNAFVAARQAVQDQLARELNAPASNNGTTMPEPAEPAHATNGNGATNNHANSNGATGTVPTAAANGNGYRNGNNGTSPWRVRETNRIRPPTCQVDPGPGHPPPGVPGPEDVRQAAGQPNHHGRLGLIDTLKSIKDGTIDLDSVLEGNAA